MEQRMSRTKILGFFDVIGELIMCNILWMLCSLPIVTIGASSVALFTCTHKILAREGVRPATFFTAFRRSMKQASIVWLFTFVVFLMITANLYLMPALEPRWRSALIAALGVILLVVLLESAHIFPLIAANRSEQSYTKLITMAFALGIRYLPLTVSSVVVQILPAVLFIAFPRLFLYACAIYAVFGIALTSLYHAFIITRIWKKARFEPNF